MRVNVNPLRSKQVLAWTATCIFLLGMFYAPVGAWTGLILSTWLAGTQRVGRGFVWIFGLALIFGLPHLWRGLPHGGLEPILSYASWALVGLALSVLPFTCYRFASPRLPGFLSTLSLPVFGVTIAAVARAWVRNGIGDARTAHSALPHMYAVLSAGVALFLMLWFASVVVWMWNLEFRAARVWHGASIFAGISAVVTGFAFSHTIIGFGLNRMAAFDRGLAWTCGAGAAILGGWALLVARRQSVLQCRPETLLVLRDPTTREPLQLVHQGHKEMLVTANGTRYTVHDGVADLRRPEDMTGANQKYNHLYETIGGFYDDIQRVSCALTGIDRDAYVKSYLDLLPVESGNSVLETSVGTGLNFKYLTQGVRLCGIDLSEEMLGRCQENMRRWQLEADLFLGNAENLPFADCSFDVVFHVGGINFFNDRAKAIQEMIRVAKPGCRFLIADETEEHVKAAYESSPIGGEYFRNREETVVAPVDLIPPEMQEVHLEILNVIGKNRFYALTFRKPLEGESSDCKALGYNLERNLSLSAL